MIETCRKEDPEVFLISLALGPLGGLLCRGLSLKVLWRWPPTKDQKCDEVIKSAESAFQASSKAEHAMLGSLIREFTQGACLHVCSWAKCNEPRRPTLDLCDLCRPTRHSLAFQILNMCKHSFNYTEAKADGNRA